MNLLSFEKTTISSKRADALPPPPKEVLAKLLGVEHVSVEWLAGDGSDRCYYRLTADELKHSFVLMQLSGSDADALKKDGYDWIKIADTLTERSISIPKYKIKIPDYAALIIEDYGDTMLESEVIELCRNKERRKIEELYLQCFEIIGKLLTIPNDKASTWCKRAFDFDKYSWELKFFFNQYVSPVAKLYFDQSEQEAFIKDCRALSTHLAKLSHYFVHRDFHSRNIMFKDGMLALIDFQDARLGPAAYDLASFLFDNYVPFALAFRRDLLQTGIKVIGDIAGTKIAKEIEENFPAVMLQRQLKAIGTYGFLTHNKKRGNYLPYVPIALATLAEDLVFDKRWPFLSKGLIQRLKDSLPVNES